MAADIDPAGTKKNVMKKYIVRLNETISRLSEEHASLQEQANSDILYKQIAVLETELERSEVLVKKQKQTVVNKRERIKLNRMTIEKGKLDFLRTLNSILDPKRRKDKRIREKLTKGVFPTPWEIYGLTEADLKKDVAFRNRKGLIEKFLSPKAAATCYVWVSNHF